MNSIKNKVVVLTTTATGLLMLAISSQAAAQSNRFGVGIYADVVESLRKRD